MPVAEYYLQRTAHAVNRLDANLVRLMFAWTAAMSIACGLRLAFAATPIEGAGEYLRLGGLYALVVTAPIISAFLALRWFRNGSEMEQPQFRLARVGRWRNVERREAGELPYFGANGLMFSLLIGMLLNIPVRSGEFLLAIPAAGSGTPGWYQPLFQLMLGDTLLFCSLYAVAFVAALRHVPLFPRLLVAIWSVDVAMQLGIAQVMAQFDDLPRGVAVALGSMLDGNIKKVFVSAALWAPYLLFSRRVNLTYRARIPAQDISRHA